MGMLDIFEQTVLTEVVKREHERIRKQAGGGESHTTVGSTILPLATQNGRRVKIRVQDVLPYGMAQLKAPGATPALWTHRPRLREEMIELVDIDELHRIDPEDMLKLKSPDPNVVKEVVWDLTQRGAAAQARNEQRTEWMRWEALKGTLVADYPGGNSITVDYGIPARNFPTAGTVWTNVSSADPVEDLWAAGSVGIDTAGIYLSKFHFSSEVWRYIRRNEKIKDSLSAYGRSVILPNESDVKQLLREGADWVITDDGYLPEGREDYKLTKWIPDGEILATTSDYSYAGHRIGDVADGWVLIGQEGQEMPTARQGMQSEWIYHRMGQQTFLRQASARIPRLYAPEAIAWLTVYT